MAAVGLARLEYLDLERLRPFGRRERRRLVLVAGRAHGKQQPAALVQRERDGLGRGPGPRPVGARDRHAQAMSGRHGLGDRVEADADVVAAPRLERPRLIVAVAVGQVEQAAGHEQRRSLGGDRAQAHRHQRARPVGRQRQLDLREAEDLERLLERLEREGHRALVLGALLGRPVPGAAVRAPRAGVRARGLDAAEADRVVAGERPLLVLHLGRRPGRRGDPAPRPLRVLVGGLDRVLHPDAHRRLVRDLRVDALEPAIPPAQALLEEADRRPRLAVLREGVRPGADQSLARAGQPRDQARDGVGVAVRPASHRVDRGLDRGVVLAHRSVAPVVVAALVREPGLDHRGRALHALEPGVAPAVPDRGRVGRLGAEGQHRGRPREHVDPENAAADVVDVVGVAVVARAHGDHGLERRRPQRRDLQPVEAAPGDPDHAHVAGAPRLGGEPLDHLDSVGLLDGQVLVEHDAVGVAAAAQVDAHAGVAVAGEVGMVVGVAPGERVALSVGQVLEDGRHRVGLGVLGQPDPRGQPRSVGHRNPGVVDPPDGTREIGSRAQGAQSMSASAAVAARAPAR